MSNISLGLSYQQSDGDNNTYFYIRKHTASITSQINSAVGLPAGNKFPVQQCQGTAVLIVNPTVAYTKSQIVTCSGHNCCSSRAMRQIQSRYIKTAQMVH